MNSLQKQFKAFLALTWYSLRAQVRNKSTFAFGFLFPIVFITIFGLIGTGNSKVNLGVPKSTDLTNPVISFLTSQSFTKVKVADEKSLEESLKQGKISGIISAEKGTNEANPFNIKLITSSANPAEAERIKALTKGVIDQSNLRIAGIDSPPVQLLEQELSGRESRYIDFALPGQIGFSLMGTAIFGTVFGLLYLKKALVLKRMIATPVKPIVILVAQGTSRLIIVLIQAVTIISVGVLVFHFYLPHGIWTFIQLLILSAIGLVAFLGFGYFMSGFATDENSAAPMVQLITLPQFLLSGTFFATDNLPKWIQPVANNLPLSYFNMAARKLTTEGGSLVDAWPYLLGLIAWGGIMYILAARTFKWEP